MGDVVALEKKLSVQGPSRSGRTPRTDGDAAREQLLRAALNLFAAKGYSGTSIREIASAAGSNAAAISYYFGDKAGLYRVAFQEPMGERDWKAITLYGQARFSLREALEGIISCWTSPLKRGEMAYLALRLRHREMLEPTGLLAEELEWLKPALEVLVAVLQRHLALKKPDDDVRQLAFSIFALSVQQMSFHDLLKQIAPDLIYTPADYDKQIARAVGYAEALVEGERRRRKARF